MEVVLTGWSESTVRNLRHAVRALRRTPVFTTTVVLTLALGIGANSAVFSAVDAVMIRPMPFPDGDQLVRLAQVDSRVPQPFVAPIRLLEWDRLNHTFQAITGYYTNDVTELSGELPEKLTQALVAPRFLRVWRVAPALGRDFTPEEEHFGGPAAALISDRLWRRRFGARADAVGRTLRIGRTGYTVVGVMPAAFLFPVRDTDLWSPSPIDAPFAQSRESTWFTAIGRLKPGVTLAEARADLDAVQAGLGREYPKTDAALKAGLDPLKESTVGGVRKSLWTLFGSVTLLLLTACTNIAALLLSRAAGRRHEIALRFSLGASRPSVAAQLLTEVFVLAISGAIVGLLVAAGASAVFRTLAGSLPRVEEIALDWKVVSYSLGCALAVTGLCGILPAVRATRRDLAGSLAQAGRSQVAGRHAVQFVLVGVQVALAVTLLAGAGLLVRSFQELGRVNPGFDAANVLTFHVATSWGETADRQGATQRIRRIVEAIGSLPGIETAAAAIALPGVPTQYQIELTAPEGRAESEPKMLAEGRAVTPGYFAAMRIPVLVGGLCREEANTSTMMVNRSFARAYLRGPAAVGRRLSFAGLPPAEVRGIVGDARETGLDREPGPTVYLCGGALQPGTFFLARTRGEPMAMAEAVRRRLRDVEPGRSAYDLTPLAGHLSEAYGENRLRTILLVSFALIAVLLACLGLYGTLSYLVHLRQRETALRLALGAARLQVVRQVLFKGLRVSILGGGAGLLLAAALGRLLQGMLYGVSPSDPATLAGAVGLVLAVSVVAALLPAVRASRLDPMRVLRED